MPPNYGHKQIINFVATSMSPTGDNTFTCNTARNIVIGSHMTAAGICEHLSNSGVTPILTKIEGNKRQTKKVK